MATDRSLPPRIARARDQLDDVCAAVRALGHEIGGTKSPHDWMGKSRTSHEHALTRAAGFTGDAAADLRAAVSGLSAYYDTVIERIRAEDRAAEAARLQLEAEAYAKAHGNPFLPKW